MSEACVVAGPVADTADGALAAAACVDLVVCACAICSATDPPTAAATMARTTLRRDGLFDCSTMVPSESMRHRDAEDTEEMHRDYSAFTLVSRSVPSSVSSV